MLTAICCGVLFDFSSMGVLWKYIQSMYDNVVQIRELCTEYTVLYCCAAQSYRMARYILPTPLTQTSVPASLCRTSMTSASLHFFTPSWVCTKTKHNTNATRPQEATAKSLREKTHDTEEDTKLEDGCHAE